MRAAYTDAEHAEWMAANVLDTDDPGQHAIRMRLWRTVLSQAASDCLADPNGSSGSASRPDWRAEAIYWVTAKGKDFRAVCENAGFDPLFIHNTMFGRYADQMAKPSQRKPAKRSRRARVPSTVKQCHATAAVAY